MPAVMKIQGRESFQKEFLKATEESEEMAIETCLVNAEFTLAVHSAEAPWSSASTVSLVPEAHNSVMGLMGLSFPSGLVHWPLSLRERRGRRRSRFSLSPGTGAVASQRSLWGPQLDKRGQTAASAGPTGSLLTFEHRKH